MFWKQNSFKPKPTLRLAGKTGLKVFILTVKETESSSGQKGRVKAKPSAVGGDPTQKIPLQNSKLQNEFAAETGRMDGAKAEGIFPQPFRRGVTTLYREHSNYTDADGDDILNVQGS